MTKYLVLNDAIAQEITFKGLESTPKETVLQMLNERNTKLGKEIFNEIKLIGPKQHICKYCATNIVDSPDKDVLCTDCREVFGHSFYSEL